MNTAAAGEFSGKVALVTGAGSGIGAATAARLAAGGAFVAVADRSAPAAEAVANRITAAGGQALPVELDVTDSVAAMDAVAALVRERGALHLAVNNAGITLPLCEIGSIPLEDWRRVMSVNVDGVFHCLRAEVAAMRSNGGGAIVNLSSIMGLDAMAGAGVYAASKHAVIGLTKAAALDYARVPIRVNAVAPGYVDTPLLGARGADSRQRLESLHPIGRMARAEEIADLIAYLLSDRAAFITGSVHAIDGGYGAR